MIDSSTQDSSERLAAEICEEIVDGKLNPGQKLNEVELATRLNVGRGPVREALKRLAERKLVVYSPNAGARVVEHSLKHIVHLFEVREHLEGAAARLAAIKITPDQKSELHTLFELHAHDVRKDPDGAYIRLSQDLNFHYVIVKASNNPILFSILCEDLYPHMRMFHKQHKHISGRGNRALEEHRRILNAIDDGDAELAELLMRRHIVAAGESLKSMAGLHA